MQAKNKLINKHNMNMKTNNGSSRKQIFLKLLLSAACVAAIWVAFEAKKMTNELVKVSETQLSSTDNMEL
jgi:hypothetical protein